MRHTAENMPADKLTATARTDSFHHVVTVEWAYPTSIDAERFDKSRSGCYIIQDSETAEPLAGPFDGRVDAERFADAQGWSFPLTYILTRNQ